MEGSGNVPGREFLVRKEEIMKNLKSIKTEDSRNINGGAKRYYCPWNDYSNTSYWKTYGHAISCAYKRGLFNIPISMIKAGIFLR